MERLPLFKALGDPSRYAIYSELGRASEPLSTTEIADRLELHPNTVRPHLERMREVGLVEMCTDSHGAVGRPQHRWSVDARAPSLGIEPSGFRMLAHLLAEVAAEAGPDAATLTGVGRRAASGPDATVVGPAAGPSPPKRSGAGCVAAVVGRLADLGFDPTVDDPPAASKDCPTVSSIAFNRCPFRELAAVYPDLICTLHRGVTEGLVADAAGVHIPPAVELTAFNSLVDADPCRMELTTRDR